MYNFLCVVQDQAFLHPGEGGYTFTPSGPTFGISMPVILFDCSFIAFLSSLSHTLQLSVALSPISSSFISQSWVELHPMKVTLCFTAASTTRRGTFPPPRRVHPQIFQGAGAIILRLPILHLDTFPQGALSPPKRVLCDRLNCDFQPQECLFILSGSQQVTYFFDSTYTINTSHNLIPIHD